MAGTDARVEADYVANSETGPDAGAVPEAAAEAETPNLLLVRTEYFENVMVDLSGTRAGVEAEDGAEARQRLKFRLRLRLRLNISCAQQPLLLPARTEYFGNVVADCKKILFD